MVSVGCWKNESNQLSKTSCTSRKRSCTINVQIHLQMRSMQQMYFVNNHWSSCPGTLSCKVQKRPKTYQSHMLFHHSAGNPELCAKKTLLSPNSSCHTKSCRNVAHVYQREFKLPYSTDLFVFIFEFATVGFHYCLLKICENMTSVRRCRTSVVR